MSVTAMISVHLEILVGDTWGDDCTIAQVKKQALDSARRLLNDAISKSPCVSIKSTPECVGIHYKE